MPQFPPNLPASVSDPESDERQPTLLERLRDRFGRRTLGIVVAVLLELLLLAVLLTLGQIGNGQDEKGPALTTFTASSTPAERPAEEAGEQPEQAQESQSAPTTPEQPRPPQPETPASAPTPIIPTSNTLPVPITPPATPATREPPSQPAPTTPQRRPSTRPLGPVMGPPAPPSRPGGGMMGDSERVGTAPNGEPMYAARWYREPTDGELSGYLSTAAGPGWGLITCRTAPDYRVEDCVALEEFPTGVRINRAVIEAAWQFKVRPPRVGGQDQVGAWVRIRIDYTTRQSNSVRR